MIQHRTTIRSARRLPRLAAAALAVALAACTSSDPMYCEKDEDCPADHVCDVPVRTCKPRSVSDGSLEASADLGADLDDAGSPDVGDLGGDQALDGQPPDVVPGDTLPPDILSPDAPLGANGSACTHGWQCLSGHCAGKVCCDKACSGECETCATGACKPKPKGTPCGKGSVCSANQQTVYSCDGSSPACISKVTPCHPYTCAGSGKSCLKSCTKNSECQTLYCDLTTDHGAKNTCVEGVIEACYVDAAASPCAKPLYCGSQTKPCCAIQDCLIWTKPPTYVIVKKGTYTENLTPNCGMSIIAVDTVGPLLDANKLPKAKVPQVKLITNTAKPALSVDAANFVAKVNCNTQKVMVYGFEIVRSGKFAYEIVRLKGPAELTLRTTAVGDLAGGCNTGVGAGTSSGSKPTLALKDAAVNNCLTGVEAEGGVKLDLDSVGVGFGGTGVKVDTSDLVKLRDVTIGLNVLSGTSGAGLLTYDATLDIDRLKVSFNSGTGISLQNSTTGVITNALVDSNGGDGVYTAYNSSPPILANLTVVNNAGYQANCGATQTFTNSILWHTSKSSGFHNGCSFQYSFVGNGSNNPKFTSSTTAPPYSLQDKTSPCVDSGSDSVTGLPALPGKDLAGKPRKVKKLTGSSSTIDQGAYELQ